PTPSSSPFPYTTLFRSRNLGAAPELGIAGDEGTRPQLLGHQGNRAGTTAAVVAFQGFGFEQCSGGRGDDGHVFSVGSTPGNTPGDRKSTRLNSSHVKTS